MGGPQQGNSGGLRATLTHHMSGTQVVKSSRPVDPIEQLTVHNLKADGVRGVRKAPPPLPPSLLSHAFLPSDPEATSAATMRA
jgi:hypothetical protein